MRLAIFTVGRPRDPHLRALVDGYLLRVRRYADLVWKPVRSAPGNQDRATVLSTEGKRLLKCVRPDDYAVALDEGGAEWKTQEMSEWLNERRLAASRVVFLIGGAHGLADSVKSRADLRLGLSRLTLQHDLALLVLAEQLYRAFSMLAGQPYHK